MRAKQSEIQIHFQFLRWNCDKVALTLETLTSKNESEWAAVCVLLRNACVIESSAKNLLPKRAEVACHHTCKQAIVVPILEPVVLLNT